MSIPDVQVAVAEHAREEDRQGDESRSSPRPIPVE